MDREQIEKWRAEAVKALKGINGNGLYWDAYAEKLATLAYNAGRAAALEEAKEAVRPKSPRPCMCDRCTCGNQSDAEACAAWDATKQSEIAIDALAEKEPQP